MKLMLVRDRNVLNTNWLVYFANLLRERGHEVVIACDTYKKLGKLQDGTFLDEKVKVVNLNAKTDNAINNFYRQVRGKILPSWWRFDKLIKQEKPDVIVCYFPVDLYNVTRFQKHNIPIVQMVHCYPPMIFDKILKKILPVKNWCLKSLKQVSVFQVLMDSYKSKIPSCFEARQVVRIANPVQQYEEKDMVDLDNEKKKIIYITRLEKNIKRPHLLIEAFSKIAKEFPDWTVEIYGMSKYPKYDKEMIDFIEEHKLEEQVFLMGYTNNVREVYRGADIHAFPSRSEGFSLAIADAMAMGLPHIGFADALSVNEVIVDNHNGFLAKDVDDFALKLKTLMQDKALRKEFGKNAREDMKNYAPEVIMDKWDAVFNSLVK